MAHTDERTTGQHNNTTYKRNRARYTLRNFYCMKFRPVSIVRARPTSKRKGLSVRQSINTAKSQDTLELIWASEIRFRHVNCGLWEKNKHIKEKYQKQQKMNTNKMRIKRRVEKRKITKKEKRSVMKMMMIMMMTDDGHDDKRNRWIWEQSKHSYTQKRTALQVNLLDQRRSCCQCVDC